MHNCDACNRELVPAQIRSVRPIWRSFPETRKQEVQVQLMVRVPVGHDPRICLPCIMEALRVIRSRNVDTYNIQLQETTARATEALEHLRQVQAEYRERMEMERVDLGDI